MKKKQVITIAAVLALIFAVGLFILMFGVQIVTGSSMILCDALGAIAAGIMLCAFSGSGLLIILYKRL